eukprot:TRINITY_DN7996_c0_g2_i1.p1 TRINITY_DN7996_c0_g2~~TRINITY_DN7996_c0_g2_i1.p1  ORF type:complete len:134 (+),score=26.16 TRINITY_DN7996_c0_g2_i1:85-486(+)
MVELLMLQETMSISSYLRILFRMYAETSKDPEIRAQIAETKLIPKCQDILKTYLQKSSDPNLDQDHLLKKSVNSYTTIVVQILRGFSELEKAQFVQHLPVFYPLLSEWITTEAKDIRISLKEIFVKIGKQNLA